MSVSPPDIGDGLLASELSELLDTTEIPEKLREWMLLAQKQYGRLHRILRRQNLEQQTLFEVISEIAVRSLESKALLAYIVQTIRGQFATDHVLIMRKDFRPSPVIRVVVNEGVHLPELTMEDSDPEVLEIARRREPTIFDELPPDFRSCSLVKTLEGAGLELSVPLWAGRSTGGRGLQGFLFLGPKMAGINYDDRELTFLTMMARMLAIAFQNETLFQLSSTDALTQVISRGHFEALFNDVVEKNTNGEPMPLSLIMLDLDHFKGVNDAWGHPAGDEVLRKVAAVLKNQVRPGDMVARYGGEEFAILLKSADSRVAMQVAERIQGRIRALRVKYNSETISVTISQGVASWPENSEDCQELYVKADEALYRAKESRDRIAMAGG